MYAIRSYYACLQCGICADACPENAITLVPQLDLSEAALGTRVLHEEEPFACIECGKLFGVKSTIERISEKLQGKHWMFTNSDNIVITSYSIHYTKLYERGS